MRYRTACIVVLLLTISSTSSAQFPWQKPPARSQKAVADILGPTTKKEPSRDLNIVWVWGIDKLHAKETHEYAWVMDRYVNVLLPQVPRVTVVHSMYFPKEPRKNNLIKTAVPIRLLTMVVVCKMLPSSNGFGKNIRPCRLPWTSGCVGSGPARKPPPWVGAA